MKKQTMMILDFGTSNVRAVMVDLNSGTITGNKSLQNEWIQTKEGFYEMNAGKLWQNAVTAVGSVVCTWPDVEIEGIGFSFFGDALIPVDENLEPLRGMIMAFDTRAQKEAEYIRQTLGENVFRDIVGGPCLSMLVCSKLLWLQKNEPEIFTKTKWFLHIQEYILAKLGLGIVSDYTMATRKTMLDIRTKSWSRELLNLTGVEEAKIGGEIHDSAYVAGKIRNFGEVVFSKEIPVVIGAHDSECGVFGMGINPEKSDILGNVSGTYEMLGFFQDTDIDNRNFPFVERGCGLSKNSLIINGSSIAGSYVKWYQKNLCRYPDQMFERIEAAVNYDGNGTIFFLADNDKRGCTFTGFDQFSSQEMLYQAIIEGITFKLKRLKDEISLAAGKDFKAIYAGGGGASSDKWLQFKADLFQIPVKRIRNMEASATGAAMIAAVGTGIFADFTEAVEVMTGTEREFFPDAAVSEKYQEKYERYQRCRKESLRTE